MTEFLTENSRRAYPLESEWPAELRERWTGTLVDACVYASAELGWNERVSLLSVRRDRASLVFTVGIPGSPGLDVAVPAGRSGFVTAYAGSADFKAILTCDGGKVDALALDPDYTTDALDVNVPFAARCAGGAVRRVTSVTAQGPADCETPVYSPSDPHRVERTAGAGEHAVLRAGEGVDLAVTAMPPLAGDILRVSAIAAPEATDAEEDPVDMVIRGDECFSVDAEPGVKVDGNGLVVPRTGEDRPGGVVRIGNACKPCCQCEDYKDAVDLLRPAEAGASAAKADLDGIKALYTAALSAFDTAKTLALQRINSPENVRITATATPSCDIYGQSDAAGTRQRIAITFLAENMAMVDASVSGTSFSVGGGFTLYDTAGSLHGTMRPGETLMAVVTYAKANTKSNAVTSLPHISASCTVQVGDGQPETRTIQVS